MTSTKMKFKKNHQSLAKLAMATFLAACCVFIAHPVLAGTFDEDFQKIFIIETAERDLNRAIQLYKDLAEKSEENPAQASKAYYRLGLCYEKLERVPEAVEAYQNVVARQSGSTTEIVENAKANLGRLKNQVEQERIIKELKEVQVKRPKKDFWSFEIDLGKHLESGDQSDVKGDLEDVISSGVAVDTDDGASASFALNYERAIRERKHLGLRLSYGLMDMGTYSNPVSGIDAGVEHDIQVKVFGIASYFRHRPTNGKGWSPYAGLGINYMQGEIETKFITPGLPFEFAGEFESSSKWVPSVLLGLDRYFGRFSVGLLAQYFINGDLTNFDGQIAGTPGVLRRASGQALEVDTTGLNLGLNLKFHF